MARLYEKNRARFLGSGVADKRSLLTGRRYGNLIVIKIAERYMEKLYWLCKCDCGAELVAVTSDLKKGKVTACRPCTRKAARIES